VKAKARTPTQEVAASARPSWRLRAAAIVGLLAPAAMAVLLAVSLAGKVGVALLAVALVLVASAAAWLALTTRGSARAAAGALALLAGAGLLAVLIANWQGVLVLVALVLLAATFGLASRYALERTGGVAAHATSLGVARVGPARTAVLIINPKSGGGKAERVGLAREAAHRGVEPIVLRPDDDLLELAETAVARGAEVVGMAGGDGSQALVATVAARLGVAHVCVPAGTRNHFALDLGLDRDDLIGAIDAFGDGYEREIDLARVNDRVFVNNASLGAYAKVVQSQAYRDAKLETWSRMLPDLLGRGAPASGLELTAPDGRICDDASLVLVSNNPYQLTHFAGAGTRARLDTGNLGVAAVKVRDAADVSRLVALELSGQAGRFPGLLSWATPQLEVRSPRPVEVGLDGEALVLQPPLRFASMPQALRVRVPRSANLAPAARSVALTAESLTALLRVAADR
jgi:diacylglycerol kinase family enzyme